MTFWRPLDPAGEQRANLCGSYPLIPWSNRIANGCFTFNKVKYRVKRNFGDHPSLPAWQWLANRMAGIARHGRGNSTRTAQPCQRKLAVALSR
ncbi:Uncharacterised protein [Citrobacter freundii]|nr:Uncharacterised protein [Citrobacter freundii]